MDEPDRLVFRSCTTRTDFQTCFQKIDEPDRLVFRSCTTRTGVYLPGQTCFQKLSDPGRLGFTSYIDPDHLFLEAVRPGQTFRLNFRSWTTRTDFQTCFQKMDEPDRLVFRSCTTRTGVYLPGQTCFQKLSDPGRLGFRSYIDPDHLFLEAVRPGQTFRLVFRKWTTRTYFQTCFQKIDEPDRLVFRSCTTRTGVYLPGQTCFQKLSDPGRLGFTSYIDPDHLFLEAVRPGQTFRLVFRNWTTRTDFQICFQKLDDPDRLIFRSCTTRTRFYPSGLECLLGLEDIRNECINPHTSVSTRTRVYPSPRVIAINWPR